MAILVLGVSCAIGLIAASGANAAWDAPGVGVCATVGPPPGQTGGKYWVNGEDGSCTGHWISDDEFQSLVNQGVAGADEAAGTAVPSDIPAADADAGGGFWDGLKAAASDLKLNAFDAFGAEEGIGLWAGIGSVALPAAVVVGGFFIGDKLGSELANIVGINAGGSGGTGSQYFSVSVEAVPAGFDLNKIDGGITHNNGQTYCAGLASPTCQDIPRTTKRDGWVVLYNVNGSYPFAGVGQCFGEPDPLYLPSGTQRIVIAVGAGTCDPQHDDPEDFTTSVYWIPGQVTALPGPGQGAVTPADTSCGFGANFSNGCTETTIMPSPTEAQQKSNATSVLQDPAYDWYSAALCQVPGSPCPDVPPPYTVTIPTPSANETWSDYNTDLQNAGITNIRRQQLSIDQAQLSKPAGAVITVDPEAGSDIYPVTNTVTVTTNPDTMPVLVPSFDDGETPDAYAAQLSALGLRTNTIALQQTDLDEPDGDVVLTDPDPGVRVEPDSTVSIEVNPTKPTMEQNEDCRPSDAPTAADPGDAPPGYVGDSPAFQDYTGSPYPGIDPRQTSPPAADIHLHWGTPSWGYRHIAIKRGYGPTDAAQTKLALSGPLYYQDPPNSNSTTWVFDYPYSQTSENGSEVQCQRRVVVQYQQKGGEPEPRHIITSFYGEVVSP